MRHFLSFLILAVVCSFFSCNDTASDTDNLYDFKEYIASHTYGRKSVTEPIVINLNKSVDQVEGTKEIPSDFLSITPKTDGKLQLENGNKLIFEPTTKLKPDTEYKVLLDLKKLFGEVDSKHETYTFLFKTLSPNFKVNVNNLQSYSPSWQYLEGTFEAGDIVDLEDAKKSVSATQNGQPLNINWPSEIHQARYYHFTIDSIQRPVDDSQITIRWNGEALGVDQEGENTFTIPGQNNFKIIDVSSSTTQQSSLSINFSDPIDAEQDFSGMVVIDNEQNLRYEVDGNLLHVYPTSRITGKVKLEVFKGLKNTAGFKIKEKFEEWVVFEALKPAVRIISKGVILPNSQQTPIHFETVNLAAVDVRVIQIYKDNVLQFLQEAELSETNSYGLRRVGRKVAQKTIPLETASPFERSNWKAHALNLADFFKADPGAIYQVEISFREAYSTYACDGKSGAVAEDIPQAAEAYPEESYREEQYWNNQLYRWRNEDYNWQERDNPCHAAYFNDDRFASINILGSNLGLLVKENTNNAYHIAVTNLLTAKPLPSSQVMLYNYQQQRIASETTGSDGIAIIKTQEQAAFAVAKQGNQVAYAKLDDGNALSLSKFDVSGKKLQRGLKGFMYTERGVHRPGDTIHLTFVLDDKANPIPASHPIQLSVTNARGKLVKQEVLTTTKNPDRAKNGFYYFPIATNDQDPTGNWQANIQVGGASFTKNLKVATVKPNRLKIALDFEDAILKANQPLSGSIQSKWLHGAPARNLKAEIEVKLTPAADAFTEHHGFEFRDPVRDFDTQEMELVTTKLSEQGSANFSETIELNKKAPGMLDAHFLSKVYEGGGDFSMDVYTKKMAPYTHFVGLQSPETKRYGSYDTDQNIPFTVISVDDSGKKTANRNLKAFVYEIEWQWWWNRGQDNLSRYENAKVHQAVKSFDLTTNAAGKADFSVNIPEQDGGRYLIRIIDEASGHATGKVVYFYKNWWKTPNNADAESAKMLTFSADKKDYSVGETAVITFPSSEGGNALISIENGTAVLSTKWVHTDKKETKVDLPITEEMAPNIYVNISLLQPHAQTKNDLPIRMYGVIPLSVENAKTRIEPQLSMPSELKPEEHYSIRVQEQNGKPMTYTIAVVDEGLLDLTRFKTPDIHQAFYAKEALGVRTFDVYDEVIGAFSGSIDHIYEIGGGDLAAGAKNRKADRFKPVVSYLGPFSLKAGETATHQLWMPNYVGSVRAMIVAGNTQTAAYGHAEKTVPVKKPLMVLASLPRKLSPGEKVRLPVTVFAMDKKIKNVQVQVKADEALVPIGKSEKSIQFNEVGEQIVLFDFEVKATDIPQNLQVFAQGNGEKAKTSVELDVFNPNPYAQQTKRTKLLANGKDQLTFSPFGVKGTNSASLEFSTLPPMDLERRLNQLIRYPHGCIEQTTSGAFPQLFIADIAEVSFQQKQEMEHHIKAAIERIHDFQLFSGGLSYWPGQSHASDWGTSYAGHFMLAAKQKGYALPLNFLSNWVRHQQKTAREWRNTQATYNTSLQQAYRLYTLALAGEPELAAMNRLRESGVLNNDAKWRLAAAYAVIGKTQVAREITRTAQLQFTDETHNRYSYGSVFRNRAMALETMVILGDDAQLNIAESLAKDLSSDTWLSTQETAYALLSLSQMAIKNGGKSIAVSYSLNGKEHHVKTEKSIAVSNLKVQQGANQLQLTNNQDNLVYVNLIQSGKLALGEELAEQQKLAVRTEFLDGGGEKLSVESLRQGTEIMAKLVVSNTSMNAVDHVAITQIFPSGWEIVNTRFTNFDGGTTSDANYTDIRDDRVLFYVDLNAEETKTFTIKLNASYLGDYYLPGTQAEAMYDGDYFARTKGKWIKVKQ